MSKHPTASALAIVAVIFAFSTSGAGANNLYVDPFGSNYISEYNTSGVKLGSILTPAAGPYGMGFDASGNLYEVRGSTAVVYTVNPQGQVSTFASSVPYDPARPVVGALGLAVDSTGDVFVALNGRSSIVKISPQGIASSFASQPTPGGIAIDASNNIYVSDIGSNSILKYTPSGSVSTYASGIYNPYGMSFDAGGNLFVASYNGHNITKITPNGVESIFASGVGNCFDVGFDDQGFLYSTDASSNGSIFKFAPDGTQTTFATGLSTPTFLTFGPEIIGLVPEAGSTAMAVSLGAVVTFALARRLKGISPANS